MSMQTDSQDYSAYPPRPEPGDFPGWSFPGAATGAFANGMATRRCHLPGRRLTSLRLVLAAGATREPGGREGVAALTAAALLEGTTTRGGKDFAAALEQIGASLYATADLAALRIALDAPATRFVDALALLKEAVRTPALADGEVSRLVNERLDEIAQEDADPQSRAYRELRTSLFAPGGRMSRPNGGDRQTVSSLTGAEVRDFYASADPAEATVITAGDLSGLDVDALLAEAVGDWPSPAAALRPPVTDEPVTGPKLIVVHRPGAVQTQLSIGHHAPGREHPDWAALKVAAHVLGGGLTSRLNALLREEKGYTYGIRSGLRALRGAGLFVTEGAVHTEVTGEAVADALAGLGLAGGATHDECVSAVRALADSAPGQYETARSVAAELADAAAHGLPVDYPRRLIDAIRQATPDGVTEAYTAHISPDALTVVAVGDAEVIAAPLEKLGFAAVTVNDQE